MWDIVRDSVFGTAVNHLSGGKFFPYRDQKPGYQIPQRYLLKLDDSPARSNPITRVPSPEDVKDAAKISDPESPDFKHEDTITATADAYIVDWDGEDDPDKPLNWSSGKRKVVLAIVCFLTFSIYIGSAIYSPSIPGVVEKFHVSTVVATLGLSLYVLAYGIGPMFLAPLQELPSMGRNPIYWLTLVIFVLLQIPTALAPTFRSLLILRFISGIFASPALATGGASIQDIYPPHILPYTLALWTLSAVAGPVLGPIVGGFVAQKESWRWPLWELMWVSGFSLFVITFFLPETHPDTILLKRARRLRKLTGNPRLRSMSEIKQAQMTTAAVAREALIRPFQLFIEPPVFFLNLYSGLAYAIFYLWFEAFPIVFGEMHHFSLGISGLPFLGIVTGASLSFAFYSAYVYFYLHPLGARKGGLVPEDLLRLAVVSGFMIPISLFIFGWTSRPSVHWIGPVIGAGLYMPGIYLLFQCVFVYLPTSYPKYAASILAGNDAFRSSLAAAFALFGRPYFHTLGVGPGCSLLAGVSLVMIPACYVLMRTGAQLRARSKYTGTG